eukprot:Gregarina_sp_Poly_1__1931@NODE_1505_length_3978_cov_198_357965_g997_i0_p3_GENE_NODE_1505_length_3978_cov_198_357965_g997_i0NODE_1505_length_3978_cov_198_357965_g997_i0_p3_ORF_typecomplete_len147_score20_95_NODE_1505_length_3978_cov_198_357965_g997_i035373923
MVQVFVLKMDNVWGGQITKSQKRLVELAIEFQVSVIDFRTHMLDLMIKNDTDSQEYLEFIQRMFSQIENLLDESPANFPFHSIFSSYFIGFKVAKPGGNVDVIDCSCLTMNCETLVNINSATRYLLTL